MSSSRAAAAWIGIGSNLGDRQALMEQALGHLGIAGKLIVRAVSSAWETSPVGPIAQAPYLNAAALIRTQLSPTRLLEHLLTVEASLGRVREQRWGPRRIDLDLLMYGIEVIDVPGLRVPHPYLMRRRFVLTPLIELAPGLRHPESGVRLIEALRLLPAEEEQVLPRTPLRLPPQQVHVRAAAGRLDNLPAPDAA